MFKKYLFKSSQIFFIWNILGALIILIISSFLSWNSIQFWKFKEGIPMFLLTISTYFISFFILSKIFPLPRTEYIGIIFTIVSIFFLIMIGIISLGRLYYSRIFLVSYYILSLAWFIVGYYIIKINNKFKFILLPSGEKIELPKIKNIDYIFIEFPIQNLKDIDGIIILSLDELTPEWSKYIVQQTLKGIPMYYISDIYEKLLGKIPLKYISDEFLENFQLSFLYLFFKRIFDTVMVLLSSPFTLFLGIIISILIKLDSEGPIFFIQERVGQGGRPYKIIKFRTMFKNAEKDGPTQAVENDPRITRIGKMLRKFRLDEIPQFINVLKGEMSLIGPRPEQVKFVEEYEQKIPFYNYRHLVKPGITGWAQVHQGYASGIEENAEKLEYDLYYIKNLSIWLDFIIILKTIKVLICKWGAR